MSAKQILMGISFGHRKATPKLNVVRSYCLFDFFVVDLFNFLSKKLNFVSIEKLRFQLCYLGIEGIVGIELQAKIEARILEFMSDLHLLRPFSAKDNVFFGVLMISYLTFNIFVLMFSLARPNGSKP